MPESIEPSKFVSRRAVLGEFFLIRIYSMQEQPLQGSELQGKEEQRLKHTGPIIWHSKMTVTPFSECPIEKRRWQVAYFLIFADVSNNFILDGKAHTIHVTHFMTLPIAIVSTWLSFVISSTSYHVWNLRC